MANEHERSTVVVTGGTGYLAGWVISGLLERGHHVRTTNQNPTKTRQKRTAKTTRTSAEAAASVELLRADLLEDEGWDAALAGADYVLHTASPTPFDTGADLIKTAREGTRRVLEAAARAAVRRVDLTTSGETAVP